MRSMKKNLLAVLLTAVMLIPVLSGCSCKTDTNEEGGTTTGGTTKVVLNEVAHSLFYAPMYVAIENGYFKEQGIDLELVTGFGADKTMTAVLSGEADIGFMGPETTVYTCNEGASDLVVNFAQLTQRAGNFLVGREADDGFTWEKLKGKDVLGGRDGGMPEMVFEYILKKNGIDPEADLNIDKSIDFGSTAAAFSAKDSYMKEHPEVIRGFVTALKKGMEYVYSHTPEEIADVIAPQFKDTDKETMAIIIKRYADQDTWKQDLVFEKEAYLLLLDILDEAGQLSARPDYEKLVTTEYAK